MTNKDQNKAIQSKINKLKRKRKLIKNGRKFVGNKKPTKRPREFYDSEYIVSGYQTPEE